MPSNTCCGVEFSGSFDAALAALNETAATIANLVRQIPTFFAFMIPCSNQDRSGDSNRPLVLGIRASKLQRRLLSSAPILRVSGHSDATPSTTKIVPMPPATTEITGPKRAAVNPDSSAPNSFDVPMKMLFTAETRPRISSGVTSCTIEPRMITLTLSNAPIRNNRPNDSQNAFDKPKRTVAIPNPVTHHSNVLPARFIGGRDATVKAITKAPTAGAARIQPSPIGPQCRI